MDGGSALPSGTAQPDLPPAEALGRSNPDQRAPNPALPRRTVLYATRPKPPAQLIRATRSYFFSVGEDVHAIVAQWVNYLLTEKLWGPDDPLFPATQVALGETHQFEACGLARTHWSNAGPIRGIFREAFERAGIPYANPHSFRATLAGLGEKLCRSPEEFKAWSQNLGHEGVLTNLQLWRSLPRAAGVYHQIAHQSRRTENGNAPAVERVTGSRSARATRHSRGQI